MPTQLTIEVFPAEPEASPLDALVETIEVLNINPALQHLLELSASIVFLTSSMNCVVQASNSTLFALGISLVYIIIGKISL
jgi:hypothetical protein